VITRSVEPGAVADLALSPPRAALAASADGEILLLPARVAVEEPAAVATSPRVVRLPPVCPDLAGRNVVVIADDGPQWFRLRSLAVRGVARLLDDCTYRVVPRRVVAWDYGSLREEASPPGAPQQHAAFSADGVPDGLAPFGSPDLEAAVETSRVMILASRSSKGTPFAVPLWFVEYRGRIYTATSASSWTVRNVAARPQVALLLGGERGAGPHRLLVRGHARSVRGAPPPQVLARVAWRYYLQPRFAAVELSHMGLWILRMRYYAQAEAAHIVVTPESATRSRAPA